MGNIPANGLAVPNVTNSGVSVSTRSSPPHGRIVAREFGIVVGNSESFTRSSGSEAHRIAQAMDMAARQASKLGGNAVLGMHMEIKQFGDNGSWMVVQVTGTACTVEDEPPPPPPRQLEQLQAAAPAAAARTYAPPPPPPPPYVPGSATHQPPPSMAPAGPYVPTSAAAPVQVLPYVPVSATAAATLGQSPGAAAPAAAGVYVPGSAAAATQGGGAAGGGPPASTAGGFNLVAHAPVATAAHGAHPQPTAVAATVSAYRPPTDAGPPPPPPQQYVPPPAPYNPYGNGNGGGR